MTTTDFQQQPPQRRRSRRRRHLRRVLRVAGPILLLLGTVLLSLGIVHVIERDVLISDQESDPRYSVSEASQQGEWQRRYDDLLREHYGEDPASSRGDKMIEHGAVPLEGLFLEPMPGEREHRLPELEAFQLSPGDPDSERDFDPAAQEFQFTEDVVPPSDVR